VIPDWRSRTNMSDLPLVSFETRFGAADENATKRPSALIAVNTLSLEPSTPVLETLTRSVVCAALDEAIAVSITTERTLIRRTIGSFQGRPLGNKMRTSRRDTARRRLNEHEVIAADTADAG